MDIQLVNVPASAKVDLERWAQITIERWQYNIASKNLVKSGNLLNSFLVSVSADAENNTALISFAFEYYMRMMDMGVGKGVNYEQRGSAAKSRKVYGIQKGNRRKPMDIYNRTLYAEIMKLGELLTTQYAAQGAMAIVNHLK